MNTQHVPPSGPLISTMPSGREIHSLKPFSAPVLEPQIIENMRAPPDRNDDYGNGGSSDEEGGTQKPVGAFPGTADDYAGNGRYY